jgi:hypothetical protein
MHTQSPHDLLCNQCNYVMYRTICVFERAIPTRKQKNGWRRFSAFEEASFFLQLTRIDMFRTTRHAKSLRDPAPQRRVSFRSSSLFAAFRSHQSTDYYASRRPSQNIGGLRKFDWKSRRLPRISASVRFPTECRIGTTEYAELNEISLADNIQGMLFSTWPEATPYEERNVQ